MKIMGGGGGGGNYRDIFNIFIIDLRIWNEIIFYGIIYLGWKFH